VVVLIQHVVPRRYIRMLEMMMVVSHGVARRRGEGVAKGVFNLHLMWWWQRVRILSLA